MAASGKVDVTGTPAAAKEAKPVHTVRFQEGVEGHLEAKARGDRSRLYFKDGSELPAHAGLSSFTLFPRAACPLTTQAAGRNCRLPLQGDQSFCISQLRIISRFARSWDP